MGGRVRSAGAPPYKAPGAKAIGKAGLTPFKWLLVVAASGLALRLALVLIHDGHLGVDGGAYLLSRNSVLGDEPTGTGWGRPPFAPGWQLVPFTLLLGDEFGYKLWGVVASMLPLVPVYLIARLFLFENHAVWPVALAAVGILNAEMLVTGALPLVAFTFLGIAAWAMIKLADPLEFEWRYPAILAACVPLIAYTSQTATGISLIVIPILLLALGILRAGHFSWPMKLLSLPLFMLPAIIGLAIGALLATTALPWYLEVAPGQGSVHYPGPWVYLTHWADIAWLETILFATIGVTAYRLAPDYKVRALSIVIIVLAPLGVLMSSDESLMNIFYRPRYLLPIFAFPVAAWLFLNKVSPVVQTRQLKYAAAVILGGLMVAGYVSVFQGQTDYSDQVTQHTDGALAYLQREAARDGVIVNTWSMGMWVAALNKVPTAFPFTQEPPANYTQMDRDVRCALGWVPGCDPLTSFKRLGASHVLVDQRFPYYNARAAGNYLAPPDQWEVTAATPWLELVYSSGPTKLWKVRTIEEVY